MKKNGLILIMVIASLSLFGQRQADRSLDERQLGRMKTELALTDVQFDQLRKVNEKFHQQRAILHADSALTRQKITAEGAKILKERNSAIQKVLSEEQFAKWTEMKENESRRRPGASASSRENLLEMKRVLGLNDQQVKNVATVNTQMTGEFRKLRSDTLTARADRPEVIKKIVADRNAKIKKILTEEQYVKFLEYEAEMNGSRRRPPQPPGKE